MIKKVVGLSDLAIVRICDAFIREAHQEFTVSDSGDTLDCDNACTQCVFGLCYDIGLPLTNVDDVICLRDDLMPRIKEVAPWKFL